jgi:C-terminal processing protease CtpA/Prc
MALFAGVAITVTACGGDSSSPVAPGGSSDEAGSVSANHGHTATVSSAQLTAGNSVTLDIRGSADHPHTVELTVAEVIQIRDQQRVSKNSSTDPSAAFGTHLHTVTFN